MTAVHGSSHDRSAMPGWTRFVCSGVGLCLLAAVSALYVNNFPAYIALMKVWMYRPYEYPFMDWEWLPAAASCWSKGINVYVQNPCFLPIPDGAHNYPPLWLRMEFLALGQDFIGVTGLVMAAGFFVVLSALPPPSRPLDLALMVLASISSLAVFGLERANLDVSIFIVTVLAACLMAGSLRQRLAAYGIFMLLGLLKFYPWILLALAIRERPRLIFAVWLFAAVVLTGHAALFHEELALIAQRGFPKGDFVADLFGAVNLPGGLAKIAAVVAMGETVDGGGALRRVVFTLCLGLMLANTVALIARLNRGGQLAAGLETLPGRSLHLLIAGSSLIVLCFFAGQNLGYRAIFLLLCLPGILALARQMPKGKTRTLLRGTCFAIVGVMWVTVIQAATDAAVGFLSPGGNATGLHALHWLIRELAWWLIVGVLSSILVAYTRLCIARLRPSTGAGPLAYAD